MAESTRDRILDAAVAVLLRDGSKGLTTKAIATQAQLTEPTLYIYFRSKAALCIAVATERIPRQEDLGARIRGLAGTGTVLGNLRSQAADVLRYFLAAMPLEIVFWADPRLRAARKDAAPVPDLLSRAVGGYLREEQRLGRVRPDSPAEGIGNALVGALFHRAFIVTFAETTLSCEDANPFLDEVTAVAASVLQLQPA
ncbi:TetR/AcrR family transcriptional regulator [Propionicimonas sp.]|uniref:TetR/AcrR family transcriptional regulator n=1 Tax=Propionicimonas sp. TaxID=1955623 RepID=UPI0039E2CA5E